MKSNICFYCKKAVGNCSWSGYDPKTKKLRYEPVPGWTAVPITQKVGNKRLSSYSITACPEYEPDDDVKRCKWCGAPLMFGSGRTSFCFDCAPSGEAYARTVNALQKKLKRRKGRGAVKVSVP